MEYNANYEITILREHLKYLNAIDAQITKQEPPKPDFLINGSMYYEVTFCSYDDQTAEIYHKINQRIPLDLDKPLDNVENNDKLVESVLKTIQKKKLKQYSFNTKIPLNLLIHVYHGPNLAKSFFDSVKSRVADTGQFNSIYVQTGYDTVQISRS